MEGRDKVISLAKKFKLMNMMNGIDKLNYQKRIG